MIEIAICDDHPQAVDHIQDSLENYFSKNNTPYHTVTFPLPSALFSYMCQHPVHIVFMDLEYCTKEEDGILWSKKIHVSFPDTLVLILTAFESRYKEGYVARAFRFMTKPLIPQELEENMDDCLDELSSLKTISIVRQNVTYNIMLKDIVYLEAYAGGVAIYTVNSTFYCDESLLHWEQELPSSLFFRCHKKYLVSLSHIEKLENHSVLLDTKEKLPVSRRKWTAFQTYFIKFNVRRNCSGRNTQ